MKVALVLFDWFAHGGLQRDCGRIGQSLLEQNVEVDVICMHSEGDLPAGLNLVKAPPVAGSKVAARKQFARFVAQQRASQSYAALIGFNRLPGLDYYFAADTCFAWKATRERNLFYRLSPRARQYLAFERAVFGAGSKTTVFMLSPLQKQEYLACYPKAKARITDIAPGIARDRMAPDNAADIRRAFRAEFGFADDDYVLLQVGTGYPVKGVDRSLEAVAALPDAMKARTHLMILGEDPHGRYASRIQELAIVPYVTLMAGRNDIPRFYQGADLLLQPSRKESAGMVLLEAIVAGLPVLTTATCGYAFHVELANAGNVVPEPFKQLALNAALQAMLDSEWHQHWRNNGIAYGRNGDFYDMPKQVAAWVLSDHQEHDHGN